MRGPVEHRSPAESNIATDELAHDLSRADDVDESHESFYPLFPGVKRGDIHKVRVFRKRPKANGTKGTSWSRIGLPFDAATITWDVVIACCGGGSFAVQALNESNQVIGSAQTTIEGEERVPRAAEAMRAAQGYDTAQVTETPMGWLAIPGHSPEVQALFMAYQQVAFFAREDFHRQAEATATMMEKITEHFMRPNPALTVLEAHIGNQRMVIEQLQTQLASVSSKLTDAQVDAAQTSKRADVAKAKLFEKGVDVIDNIAGTVVAKLAETQQAKELPANVASAAVQTITRGNGAS